MVVFSGVSSFLLLAFVVSLTMSLAIVATKELHIHRTAKGHAGLAVQSAHRRPTPRIGGLAIGLALAVVATLSRFDHLLATLLICAIPVSFAGFAEDFGYSIAPRRRLLAAMASGLAMILTTGYVIDRGVFPGGDPLFSFAIVAGAGTIFVTAGICHSVNLIDGMNGLSSLVALVGSLSLAYVAYAVGDGELMSLALVLSATVAGFLVLNFPFGKLFLGDAGAYTIGFALAFMCVALIARDPGVVGWSVFLSLFWPCFDTIYTIFRRLKGHKPLSSPDKMHFHHLVSRVWDHYLSDDVARRWSNPLTTAAMMPFVCLPPLLACLVFDDAQLVAAAIAFCIAIYVGSYQALVWAGRSVFRSIAPVR